MNFAGRQIRTILGFLLVLFGGLGMTGSVNQYEEGKDTLAAAIAMFIFFALMFACGIWLLWMRNRWAQSGPELSPEQRVLGLAESRQGRVTVEEVAAHCNLSLQDGKRLLDQLVVRNVARMLVTDAGVLVYDFPGLLSPVEKEAAGEF